MLKNIDNNPQQIYSVVLADVNNLVAEIKVKDDDDDAIKAAHKEAQEKLLQESCKIRSSLDELKNYAQWDIFTIAFYGETGVGKSTLIETLRILLHEPTKEQQRAEFELRKKQYDNIEQEIAQCTQNMSQTTKEYQAKGQDVDNQINKNTACQQKLADQITALEEQNSSLAVRIKIKKKSSILKFFGYIFGNLAEQKQIKVNNIDIAEKKVQTDTIAQKNVNLLSQKDTINAELNSKIAEIKAVINKFEADKKQYDSTIAEVADGNIIGDGRSDFTRDVTKYEFDVEGQKIAMLDVPGIEGNEKLVQSEINAAMKTAHAVFFITRDSRPPQTSDGKGEGTLEKIKRHLGDQTEVYAIFNKRITNPSALKESLISDGEQRGLDELNQIMRKHLGNHYIKCISISALPAFLSMANCWRNDLDEKMNKNYKYQKNFLEHYDKNKLLQTSKITDFSDMLIHSLASDCEKKIKKSNYNKVADVVRGTANVIQTIQEDYKELPAKLRQQKQLTDQKINNIIEEFKRKIRADANTLVRDFQNEVRTKIYEDIERDISKDEFKEKLKKHMEDGGESVETGMKIKTEKIWNESQEEIKQALKKYMQYAEELMSMKQTKKLDATFQLDIDIKSGIKWGDLVFLGASIITAVFIPIMWIPAIWEFGKIIWSWVSTDYKMSQQRKSADKEIDKAAEQIKQEIGKNIIAMNQPLEQVAAVIKSETAKTITHIEIFIGNMHAAQVKFEAIVAGIEQISK